MTKHEVWHRGTKSFCDVHRQTRGQFHDQHWIEAPRGEQLPEADFTKMHKLFERLEASEPRFDWYYIRYDNEAVMPETLDNTTFKYIDGEWKKAL